MTIKNGNDNNTPQVEPNSNTLYNVFLLLCKN